MTTASITDPLFPINNILVDSVSLEEKSSKLAESIAGSSKLMSTAWNTFQTTCTVHTTAVIAASFFIQSPYSFSSFCQGMLPISAAAGVFSALVNHSRNSLLNKQTPKADNTPANIEEKSSKPTESIAGSSKLMSTAWNAFQTTCTVHTTAAIAASFFIQSRYSFSFFCQDMLPISAAAGVLSALVDHSRNSLLNKQTPKADNTPANIEEKSVNRNLTRTEILSQLANSIDRGSSAIVQSLWTGLKVGSTALIALGLADSQLGYRTGSSMINIINYCMLIGSTSASLNLLIRSIKNTTPKPEGRILSAITSIFWGVVDGCTTLLSMAILSDSRRGFQRRLAEDFIIFSSGVYLYYKFFKLYINSLKQSEQKPTLEQLKKVGHIYNKIGSFFLSEILPLLVVVGTATILLENEFHRNTEEFYAFAISAITGLASTLENYYSKIKGIAPEQRIRKSFFEALPLALTTYALAFLSTGAIIQFGPFNLSPLQKRNIILGPVFASSAILGIIQAAQSVFRKSNLSTETNVFSFIYQKWKRLSKVRKLGSALTLLAGLTVLYLGGPKKTYKIGSKKINQAYEQISQFAIDQFQQIAFHSKSDITKQTVGQHIAGLSKEEEIERLADMVTPIHCSDGDTDCQKRSLDDFFCAQILQTCHLDETDIKGHKKAYRKKMIIVHPDKNPGNEELAEKARKALDYAKTLIDEKKECLGQDEFGCEMNDNMLEVGYTLREPTDLFKKLLGLNTTCTFYVNNIPHARPLDDCKHLSKNYNTALVSLSESEN